MAPPGVPVVCRFPRLQSPLCHHLRAVFAATNGNLTNVMIAAGLAGSAGYQSAADRHILWLQRNEQGECSTAAAPTPTHPRSCVVLAPRPCMHSHRGAPGIVCK